MGFFGGKKGGSSAPKEEYLEGHPEVADSITQYEGGLMSALGKTTGELAKTAEGVLQALQQSSRSPYSVGEERQEDTPSSGAPGAYVTRSCYAERQLVKDCLQRIADEAKARRFDGPSASPPTARGADNTAALLTVEAKAGHLPTTATPPPSFLFANFPSCDAALKRYTVCSEGVAGDYSAAYGRRVDAMLEQRLALQRQQQAGGGPSLPSDMRAPQ